MGSVTASMPQKAMTMSLREPWFRYSKCAEAMIMSLHEPFGIGFRYSKYVTKGNDYELARTLVPLFQMCRGSDYELARTVCPWVRYSKYATNGSDYELARTLVPLLQVCRSIDYELARTVTSVLPTLHMPGVLDCLGPLPTLDM